MWAWQWQGEGGGGWQRLTFWLGAFTPAARGNSSSCLSRLEIDRKMRLPLINGPGNRRHKWTDKRTHGRTHRRTHGWTDGEARVLSRFVCCALLLSLSLLLLCRAMSCQEFCLLLLLLRQWDKSQNGGNCRWFSLAVAQRIICYTFGCLCRDTLYMYPTCGVC